MWIPLKFASWSRISKLFCRKRKIRFCNEGRRVESLAGGFCVSLLCVLAAPPSRKCVELPLGRDWHCLCAPRRCVLCRWPGERQGRLRFLNSLTVSISFSNCCGPNGTTEHCVHQWVCWAFVWSESKPVLVSIIKTLCWSKRKVRQSHSPLNTHFHKYFLLRGTLSGNLRRTSSNTTDVQ